MAIAIANGSSGSNNKYCTAHCLPATHTGWVRSLGPERKTGSASVPICCMQLAGGGMPTSAPFFLVCVGLVLVSKQHFLVATHMGGLSIKYPNFLPGRSLFRALLLGLHLINLIACALPSGVPIGGGSMSATESSPPRARGGLFWSHFANKHRKTATCFQRPTDSLGG
jgi:hypothetical protein